MISISWGQVILKEPLSSRQTGYSITAKLNSAEKVVEGEMKAYWVNISSGPVGSVRMHLYLNAFRNRNSTFFSESEGTLSFNKENAGWIEINYLRDKKGNDLLSTISFVSPDDGNTDDRTVIEILLKEACLPGDTVILNTRFKSKLPAEIIRTGASGNFFFVAQWFPKFGVYEPAGMRYSIKPGWNCHQFHLNSEFYANHSVYDVRLILPQDYVAGTCGLLLNEKDNGDGTKTLTYRAEDIVDFAWTAWPGYAVYKDKWNDVNITLLSPPERKNQVKRQMQAVKNSLEYFTKHVGPYPWPYVTIVDPPYQGNGAGGMEYTTLFTSISVYAIPGNIRLPEMVTIHEFGHAFFMGILASNEFEEPWLDEGVNSFFEGRIVDSYYGINSGLVDLPFIKVPDRYVARASYINSGSRQTVSNAPFSWNYPHQTYSMMSYHKTAVIFETLAGIIGEDIIDEIFHEYYRKWAFRNPSGKDFINIVNEVVAGKPGKPFGNDMNWFFDQTLYGTEICDYRVSDINNRIDLNSVRQNENDSTGTEGKVYRSSVELERTGGIKLPVDVLVHFDNGREVLEHWDGISRTMDYEYNGNEKIQWVKIDPDYKIRMDVNYTNNSMTVDTDREPLNRITYKLVSFIQFFMSFISL
jgi:hypothetical protein